jgi:lipopolysaccharide export system permease protein
MKLLHRHLFVNVAGTSLAAVGLFTFILLLGNVLKELLGYVLSGQMELDSFVRLVGLLAPTMVSYALPGSILTGVLLVLGRMSSDREITAIRASGVSVAGISAPIFFLALLGVAGSLAVNFYYMPTTRLAYQREFDETIRRNPLSFIEAKRFIRDFRGIVLYVGEKKGDSTLKDFWLWEVDSQGRVRRFARADEGRITYDEASNNLVLTVQRAQIEVREEKDPENFAAIAGAPAMERATFYLPLDRVTGGGRSSKPKPKWLTLSQLLEEWRRLGQPDPTLTPEARLERERQRMKIQITFHEKCAAAFSVLSFALLAIPLGIKVSRKETTANLGIAVALALGYYFATFVVNSFDKMPALRPDLLIWLPNFGFQALGIWMFRKVDRA